jgi:hypothetical protein
MKDAAGDAIELKPEQARESGQPSTARPEASSRLSEAQLRAAESVLDSYASKLRPQSV